MSLRVTAPFSLRARWVLPVDRPPIEGGVVTIADGLISEIGTKPIGPTEDLGDVALLPGLINAHTHLEFSELQQPLGQPGMSLPDWIRLVISSRQPTRREPSQAITAGLQESRQLGVTVIGDIATDSMQNNRTAGDPHVIAFQEVIGFSAARCDSALAEVEQRLAASNQRRGISPHAPYTIHPRLLQRLIDLASTKKFGVAMHLAESPEELELLANGTGPFQQLLEERSMWDRTAIPSESRPMNYLELLAKAPRALVIHGNYLTSKEIEYVALRRERMSIAYCPRTHAYFGHTAYPLQKMFDLGARVALGTDSRASNPDLSLLGEMRHVAQQHQGISAEQILRMGTLSGAEALGLANSAGSISTGKWANLTAVPCDAQAGNPITVILTSNAMPTKTWISGREISSNVTKPGIS